MATHLVSEWINMQGGLMSGLSNKDAPLAELASILAAGYLRLLASEAEKARTDAVSHTGNGVLSGEKHLDSLAETRPPCVVDRAREAR